MKDTKNLQDIIVLKTLYGIRLLSIPSEMLSLQHELVRPFKDKLIGKIKQMELNMNLTYNADEGDLYWKLSPEKVCSFIWKICSRDRIRQIANYVYGIYKCFWYVEIKRLIIGKLKIRNHSNIYIGLRIFDDCLNDLQHILEMVLQTLSSLGMSVLNVFISKFYCWC